ncbi:hypothetical protein [Eudoraea adriatica]|uniref:hypothetical protein n=1 Tax=Eudoraea adriatica TaxID=446681 RepID=UPI00037D08A7|nr:hypothetical protein [Eudoraea adriatica]
MINVLWIDDEHQEKEMDFFKLDAQQEGINLIGYTSFEEGFEKLESNLNRFDCILLDGLFFEKKNQVKGTEDVIGLGKAIGRINSLESKKVFPWFVLSGKDKFTKGENDLLKANKAKCFDKTKPQHLELLFKAIKDAVSNREDYQLKLKYKAILEITQDEYLGKEHYERLLILIRHLEGSQKIENSEDQLNSLRKVIESVFTKLGKMGIIPEEILQHKGWINGSSLFLSNMHSEYEHLKAFVLPVIGENIHRLLNIVQDGAHSEGNLRLKVDEYLNSSKSDYLFRSSVYLLFDVLLWFKGFVDKHPYRDSNLTLWGKKNISEHGENEWIEGEILEVKVNGWGTFKPNDSYKTIGIPPYMIEDNDFKEGNGVKVITEPSPDGQKTYIKEILPITE